MSVYKRYCTETTDEKGNLTGFTLNYPDDFNFGYDVVDAIADETPEKRAMVWCNTQNEEHIFTFSDIKKYSNKMANVFRENGIKQGDRVMLVLKRHYEYWFAVVALHKLGAVAIPATHMLTQSDFIYRIKAAEVKGIVCTCQNNVPQTLRAALKQSGRTARLWCVQGEAEGFDNLNEAMFWSACILWRMSLCFCILRRELPVILKGSFTIFLIPLPI